ncbi:signal peptidase II [Candidatus Woesearchaeota archaeon]|jgi:signal peptidase II|nr:signal peptidase II [Candidatus Woesearchaeota archaeon]
MVKKYPQLTLFTIITLVIILLDQLTKYIILKFQPNLNLKILSIQFIQNTGAGFGIFKGQTFILAIISLIVAIVILAYYKRIPKENIPQVLVALLLGGTLGNMIDRFFRGYVIDFLNFHFWPAFNIADAALSISVIGLIIYFWKK